MVVYLRPGLLARFARLPENAIGLLLAGDELTLVLDLRR